jgi:hypothetical protein
VGLGGVTFGLETSTIIRFQHMQKKHMAAEGLNSNYHVSTRAAPTSVSPPCSAAAAQRFSQQSLTTCLNYSAKNKIIFLVVFRGAML